MIESCVKITAYWALFSFLALVSFSVADGIMICRGHADKQNWYTDPDVNWLDFVVFGCIFWPIILLVAIWWLLKEYIKSLKGDF